MVDTRIMRCDHCHKQSDFVVRGEGTKNDERPIDSPYNEGQDIITWRILECKNCKNPIFEEVKTSYAFVDHDLYAGLEIQSSEATILYPETHKSLNFLPNKVEKRYKEALKVQHTSPTAFAVMVGLTLETVCNHENAAGTRLVDQIKSLASSGRIPEMLAEMAHRLRQIRNLGAHDKEGEVTEEDVPIILDFVEAILEYLYVAPAKLELVKKRLYKTS